LQYELQYLTSLKLWSISWMSGVQFPTRTWIFSYPDMLLDHLPSHQMSNMGSFHGSKVWGWQLTSIYSQDLECGKLWATLHYLYLHSFSCEITINHFLQYCTVIRQHSQIHTVSMKLKVQGRILKYSDHIYFKFTIIILPQL
jgi:hypothetical protein